MSTASGRAGATTREQVASAVRSLITAIAGLAFLAGGGLEAIVRSVASPVHTTQLALLGPMLMREGTAALGHGLALAAPIVLAALIPGAQALVIPGRDHMLAVGDRVFKSAVIDFLAKRP